MTIHQAEQYFRKYNGLGFHMWHDEPNSYEKYKNLNIKLELEEKWRQQLVDEKLTLIKNFDLCGSSDFPIWRIHFRIIEIMISMSTNKRENALILFEIMEEFYKFGKKQKILIAGNMAGGNSQFTDGGIFFICSNSELKQELVKSVDILLDFECISDDDENIEGWTDMRERYFESVGNCKRAFRKF